MGENIYYVISDQFGEYAYTLAIGLFVLILGLYMFDAECWGSEEGGNNKVAVLFLDLFGFVLLCICERDLERDNQPMY
jgi:hypothetical protein